MLLIFSLYVYGLLKFELAIYNFYLYIRCSMASALRPHWLIFGSRRVRGMNISSNWLLLGHLQFFLATFPRYVFFTH